MAVYRTSMLVFILSVITDSSIGQSTGDLRIVPFSTSEAGRGVLEIYINGRWGTICDTGNYFSYTEGTVACKQLGYTRNDLTWQIDPVNQTSLSWLKNVDCPSSPTPTLLDCVSGNPGSHAYTCNDGRIIGIACIGCEQYTCNDGSCPKPSPCDGSLVCPEEHSSCDVPTTVGPGPDNHLQTGTGITDGSLRLVSSIWYRDRGRLEIYINGEWGTICDYDATFSPAAANMTCKQLGFVQYASFGRVSELRVNSDADASYPLASSNVPKLLDNIFCHSKDKDILHCHHNALGAVSPNCHHSYDIGIHCSNCNGFLCGDGSCEGSCRYCRSTDSRYCDHADGTTSEPQFKLANQGDLRLVNRVEINHFVAGRLEVFMNGQWGTICSSVFTKTEADLACRQLGFHQSREYGAYVSSRFAPESSTVPILLNSVDCHGYTDHHRLLSCDHLVGSNCVSTNLVGLSCSRCERFLCPDGSCVSACDGSWDCANGEDEDRDVCVVAAVTNMYGRLNALIVFLLIIGLMVAVCLIGIGICYHKYSKKSPQAQGYSAVVNEMESSDRPLVQPANDNV